jgi:hypothetical protein
MRHIDLILNGSVFKNCIHQPCDIFYFITSNRMSLISWFDRDLAQHVMKNDFQLL